MSEQCICGSPKTFSKCCDRFLNQGQTAKTPEQLMRSRYTAYALGGYGDYLLKTWLPSMAQDLSTIELSQKSHDWYRLDVLNKTQQGDNGSVEFKAYYRDENGTEHSMHEKSVFKRITGQWLYIGGEVT